jgi:hypothetical protein
MTLDDTGADDAVDSKSHESASDAIAGHFFI